LVLWLLCAIAPAAASADYNTLPGEALGGDVPYQSVAVFDATTPEFQTQNYTLQPEEQAQRSVFTACNQPKGSKDGWVRFDAGVAGNLAISVQKDTSGGIFFKVYGVASTNPSFSELAGREIGCESAAPGNFQAYAPGWAIPAHTVVFVQVLMVCNVGNTCEEPEEEAAQGGETKVHLRFTPANADGDAFPDTLDLCPTTPGTFHGCPDSDGDGVGDGEDACPTVKGKAPNGCRRPDEDGDGYPSIAAGGTDCNDENAAIHPGAKDIPGDGIDQNCDGHDAAYPVVHNEIEELFAYSPRQKRTIGFLAPLKVAGPLVKGMVVRLTCTGRGCPFSRQAVAVHHPEPGGLTIGKKLVRQDLAPGAAVTLSVTRPQYIGEAIRFIARKQGKMRVEQLCVPVGSTTPKKKCT
jgi:hypothetical protein